MPDYDRGYKLMFSNPEMVRELMLGFVREEWVKELDFDSLERVAGSYVSDDLRERHDDLVWRLRFADQWLYLYIILEIQSREDTYMAARLLTYVGLLYQDLIKGKQFTKSGKLPPVLPIVLYNGEPRWRPALEVFDLIENIPGSLAKYSPRLRYLLVDEGAYRHTELESLKSLVATLFQLEKTPPGEVSGELLGRFVDFSWDKKEIQRAVAVFLTRVYFDNKVNVSEIFLRAKTPGEATNMLEKNREKWEQDLLRRGEAKGKAEGEAEGDKKALLRVAKRMLAAGAKVEQIVEITELPMDEVLELQKLRDSAAH